MTQDSSTSPPPPPIPPRLPPTSSAIPRVFQNTSRLDAPENPETMPPTGSSSSSSDPSADAKAYKIPLLRFRAHDVLGTGTKAFFDNINVERLLKDAVLGVLMSLYTPQNQPKHVRSVTVILRPMGGVAYTTGSELDDEHKEIHFSTDYITDVQERSQGKDTRGEILGVIRHEMVHCFQYNAKGTCNGGLIEGIADWVRYKAGFIPAHWHIGSGNKWDDGYQNTAYFLLWLEKKWGKGTVPAINLWLKDHKYSDELWETMFGAKPEELWKEYKKALEGGKEEDIIDKVEPFKSQEPTQVIVGKDKEPARQGEDDASSKAESYAVVSPPSKLDGADDGAVSFFQISEARLLARDRLFNLKYTGRGSFQRFLRTFEGLIQMLDSKMSDSERKILLVTALSGDVEFWLDAIDPDGGKSYSQLKAELQARSINKG